VQFFYLALVVGGDEEFVHKVVNSEW
jgi:hypothetical protein